MKKNQLGKVNTQFKEMTDKVGMLIKKKLKGSLYYYQTELT